MCRVHRLRFRGVGSQRRAEFPQPKRGGRAVKLVSDAGEESLVPGRMDLARADAPERARRVDKVV